MRTNIVRFRRPVWLAGLTLALVAFAPSRASADFTVDLTTEFSGTNDLAGSPPYLRATFHTVSTGTVELTLTSLLQGSTEFVSIWGFNFVPGDASGLAFAETGTGEHADAATPILKGSNVLQFDGDGKFDIVFQWNTSNQIFGPGAEAIYTITGTGITAESFLTQSATGGGNGIWISAAHVQGTGGGSQSDFIGGNTATVVPAPAGIILAFSGLVGFGLTRLRQLRGRRATASA
jgi:hypothetical protein